MKPKSEPETEVAAESSSPGTYLHVKALTWLRDSHGLYDYESFQNVKRTLKTDKSCIIGRCGHDVKILSEAEETLCESSLGPDKISKLAALKVENGKYYIQSCSSVSIHDSQLDKIWLIVNSTPKKEVYLKRGDIIKMGRVAFLVKDYRIEEGKEAKEIKESKCKESSWDWKVLTSEQKAGKSDVCRFCFAEEQSSDNPLLTICKCTGSLKFVHFQCLKMWIKLKLVEKNTPNISSYNLKTFECEICKTPYPYSVKLEDTTLNFIDIKKPEKGNFIQLETFVKDKNYARLIHVIQPDAAKSKFKLGRGHDSEVKIADISVSRVHASISYSPNGFLLHDNAAKFGTLLLLPSTPQEISPINGLSVQVNRTNISLTIKPNEPAPINGLPTFLISSNLDGRATTPASAVGTSEDHSENVSGDEIPKKAIPETLPKKPPTGNPQQ